MHDEYTSLYKELFPVLVRSMTSVIGDSERATDLVQDVFVRVWHSVSRDGYPANLKAFIYQAYKYAKIDYFRLRYKNANSSLDWMTSPDNPKRNFHPIAEDHINPEKEFAAFMKKMEAIGLSRREVECLGLWVMGVKPRQIAKDLGIDANNVSMIIHRAKAKLR
jgi:RNA polymerase sigma-70 factor (ECF subfamily)